MIEFDKVRASYTVPGGQPRTVFENLSLYIARGDFVYVVGPTGSGKSTLLRMLYMDTMPEKGTVRVADYNSDRITESAIPYLRRSIGVVFQDFQLLPDRDTFENVAFPLYVTGQRGKAVRNRVLHVLSWVGLSHKSGRYPHELSGGEQQRVVIARAIVNEPWVLLADEPTGNLDPAAADGVQRLLLKLHAEGMTIVMATHDYRIVRKYRARTLAVVGRQLLEVDPESLAT